MLVIPASQWSCAGQPLYYYSVAGGAFWQLGGASFLQSHSFWSVEKASASVSLVGRRKGAAADNNVYVRRRAAFAGNRSLAELFEGSCKIRALLEAHCSHCHWVHTLHAYTISRARAGTC